MRFSILYAHIPQIYFHSFLNPGQHASHTFPLIENGDKTKMRDKQNDTEQPEGFVSPRCFMSVLPSGFCKDNRPSQLMAPFLLQVFWSFQLQLTISEFSIYDTDFFHIPFQREGKKREKLTIKCMLRGGASLKLFYVFLYDRRFQRKTFCLATVTSGFCVFREISQNFTPWLFSTH